MLAASNFDSPFDRFETCALILRVGPAQLLDPARHSQIPAYAGSVAALTLLGWGVGGTSAASSPITRYPILSHLCIAATRYRSSHPSPGHPKGPAISNRHPRLGEEIIADEQVVQVSGLLDERGLSSFQIRLLVWSIFIVIIDGSDIGAIAFAAPALVKSPGVAPSALGPLFNASLVGILIGSGAFG